MFNVIGHTVRTFTQMQDAPWVNLGSTLLVGEGNLSFSKALLMKPLTNVTSMVSTTYESRSKLSEDAIRNSNTLRRLGTNILHNVDASHLENHMRSNEFDTIIFQFPNVGSRDAKYGRNPNHILIRNFLRSAKPLLSKHGQVLITVVDNPHYSGVFNFDDAASFAGYAPPMPYPFNPNKFSDYSHVNTNDKDSAIDNHTKFTTWVFKPKQ